MALFNSFRSLYSNNIRTLAKSVFFKQYSEFWINNRKCSSLSDSLKPYLITRTYQSTPETLRVQFQDSSATDFHYIWLRDNCSCEICVHPKSKQKILDTTSISLDIAPDYCQVIKDGNLKILWPEKEGKHHSIYHPLWLHKYNLTFGKNLPGTVYNDLPPVLNWNGEYLQENLPEVEYDDLMETQDFVHICLENFHKLGFVVLRNVPCEEGVVIHVVYRILNVQNTRSGSSFHISTENAHKPYSSMTTGELNLHTDMNYREKYPGVVFIHCLEASSKNSSLSGKLGTDIFVDGFAAAHRLKEKFPTHYRTLTSVPVKFHLFDFNMHYVNYQPILKLTQAGDMSKVHFNGRMMAPLEGPTSSIINFYEAYNCFNKVIKQPDMHYSFSLNSGDLIMINNRRILHGRNSFDSDISSKHLEVAYAGIDDVTARYRYFLEHKTVI